MCDNSLPTSIDNPTDGIVDKMFIEPEVPGDPYGVSDADTMLAYIAPDVAKPLDVTIFSRRDCAYCAKAKTLLKEAGIEFEGIPSWELSLLR